MTPITIMIRRDACDDHVPDAAYSQLTAAGADLSSGSLEWHDDPASGVVTFKWTPIDAAVNKCDTDDSHSQ